MSDNSTSSAPPIADQVKEQAHQAIDQGKQAVQQGKEMAGGLLDRTRELVKTQLGTQKDNAVAGLNDVAQALLLSSNHLQEQGQGGVAHYADTAAEKITSLSGYLRQREVEDVLSEVQDFARQKPALFLGGTILLGLAAGRFLKSSSPDVAAGATGGTSVPQGAPNPLLPVPVSGVYDTSKGAPDTDSDANGRAWDMQPEAKASESTLRTSDAT